MDERVELALVGVRLRRWRDERNLSGPEVAEAASLILGREFGWLDLRQLERAEAAPDASVAQALCTFFGRTTQDLLGPETSEEANQRQAAETPPPPPDTRPESLRRRSPLRPRAQATTSTDGDWDLQPGQRIKRTLLHDRLGGRRYGGIAPSAQIPVVMVFSDPHVGKEHGYLDRWEDEEHTVFLYCGEGQQGDQKLDQGNGAILNHRREHRSLRLFEGSSGIVTYAGEFEIAHTTPYVWEQAPSSGGGPMRRVVMFRLVPVD